MNYLCQLQNLNIAYGDKNLFKNAQLSIQYGDRIGLLGLNGQGKSTLFKVLSGVVIPDASNPSFIFSKSTGKDYETAYSVFHVPQELPFTEEAVISQYVLFFYPELHQLERQRDYDLFTEKGGWDLINQYESYLKLFGIDDWERPVHLLSGGEQRKLALAIGLSSKASLILWDEPTNHLDLETIELFEEELLQTNQGFILITHDRYLLNRVTKRLLHIEKGYIHSFDGNYFDYLNHLENREQERQHLLDKMSNYMRREEAWMRQGIKARGTRSKKRVEGYLDLQSAINQLKSDSKKKVDMNLHSSGRKTRLLIELKDITFRYNEKIIFNQLEGSIYKGDKIALLGPNGCGKTTLLKLIMNEIDPQQGIVKRADDLTIHYFSQQREAIQEDKTAFEIVGEGQSQIELPDGSRSHVNAYLEGFLFSRFEIHRPVSTYSGGEKNRLQLAMFLKRNADLWIFDEPTNDLDLETLTILENKLKHFPGTVLLVSHDRAFIEQVAKKAWVIDKNQGKIEIFSGGAEQALMYLKALNLEKQNEESHTVAETEAEVKVKVKVKVSQKIPHRDKKKWEELPLLIEQKELKIAELEKKLADFDYSRPSNNEALLKYQQEKDKLQIEYDQLFEEWTSLEEKYG